MAARALVALALAVLAAGSAVACGTDESEPPLSESTELTLTLDPDGPGGEPAQKAEVACPRADAPQSVCAAIDALPENATAPVPPDMACTEIYGGPDVLELEGTLAGEEVNARFTRANGCEIERFDRFADIVEVLFPNYEPGAAIRP